MSEQPDKVKVEVKSRPHRLVWFIYLAIVVTGIVQLFLVKDPLGAASKALSEGLKPIGFILTLGVLLGFRKLWMQRRRGQISKVEMVQRARILAGKAALLAAGFGLVVCVFFLGFEAFSKPLEDWIRNPGSSGWKGWSAVIGVIVFGFILFMIRLKWRAAYGLTEVVAGAIFAKEKMSNLEVRFLNPLDKEAYPHYVFFLTACIYLIVRGMDNIHQGYTKDPRDPLLKWFLGLAWGKEGKSKT